MAYRPLEVTIWKNPKVKNILKTKDHNKILVFFFLISSPDSHSTGLYHIAPWEIAGHLSLEIIFIKECLSELEDDFKWIMYDYDNECIFIKGLFKRSRYPSMKVCIGAVKHIKEIKSPLVNEFIKTYPLMKKYLDDKLKPPTEKIEKKPRVSAPEDKYEDQDDFHDAYSHIKL
jgi:hypothetical protein